MASLETRIAVIGATAALIGTLAGGGIAWWQTRDIQDRQFARDDHVRAVAAGAAAAIEAGRYDAARSAVETMETTHYYYDVSESLKPRLSVGDDQLVVAALDTRGRQARNQAELCVKHLASVVHGHAIGRDRIPRPLEPALKQDGACVGAAAKAMARVAARGR